ncbi:hypothetical protein T03_5548 [Trichinella britovi]|uniref:Uncharacterized protein n=1 Tax=Trichinella britovi TaxID=45882 RepID=A0A0V1C4J8_TRIBR|nr:hypothetical protein T03_1904 [Trichinella britovi]KRY44181.1 hypothetical protein T03_5548 [Trichinella britovi]
MNSRPNLKKLVDGESRFMPPLTVSQEISAEDAQGLKVTIYSKGEKSRYGNQKSQAKEPAMTVCIADATIFTRFNKIVVNVENCFRNVFKL